MKTVKIYNEEIKVNGISLEKTSSNGTYKITLDIEFEGVRKKLTEKINDSEMYDRYKDIEGDKEEWLFNELNFTIESIVENYYNSL